MPNVKLRYTPLGGSVTETTLRYLAVRGGGEPDSFEIFPGIQHKYLSGAREEQIKGLVRRITLDLGVLDTHAKRIAILNFLLDAAREIEPTISAPTGLAANLAAGGSLPNGTAQFYKVTAVDDVGETVGSAQATATPSGANLTVNLSWNAVTGAKFYKVYRSTTTGVPGSTQFLAYATTNSYTDNGSVSLMPGAVPTDAAIEVALADPTGYENQWLDNVELGRYYTLDLVERSLRTYHV